MDKYDLRHYCKSRKSSRS